ncbi:MAG: methyl-accepting chemotaxis protein [Lachnospiraceae bacterium]
MQKKSIIRNLTIPIAIAVCTMVICLLVGMGVVFTKSYSKIIYGQNRNISKAISAQVKNFMDTAYNMSEELAVNKNILTMDTKEQTPILESCVSRNDYFELLYIQGMNGMQTGRSTGELADRSTRWWFMEMMERKEPFISKSYYSVNTNMPCTSIFLPMEKDGEMIGVFASDIKLNSLQSLIGEYTNEENGQYSFIIDGEGVVVAHPDNTYLEELYNYKALTKTVSKKDGNGNTLVDADGNVVTEEKPIKVSEDFQKVIEKVMMGESGKAMITLDGKKMYCSYDPIPLKGESDSWAVVTVQEKSKALALLYRILMLTLIIGVVIVVLVNIVIVRLVKKITNPIDEITDMMSQVSEGDFEIRAKDSSVKEISYMSEKINNMVGKFSNILRSTNDVTEDIVNSSDALKDIAGSTSVLENKMQEITEGATEQSRDTDALFELTSNMQEQFDQLHSESMSVVADSKKAITIGEDGNTKLRFLQENNKKTLKDIDSIQKIIQALDEKTRHISEILSTINSISEQTSLLALNASIEAARAGEHGKGFSVVADEIGKLAENSGNATMDVASILDGIRNETESTVEMMNQISEKFREQIDSVNEVEGAFAELNQSSVKISEDIGRMEPMIEQMKVLSQEVVASTEQIADISRNTVESSQEIYQALNEERRLIEGFSDKVEELAEVSMNLKTDMTKF